MTTLTDSRLSMAALLLALLTAPARAGTTAPNAPPLVGQPLNFSGAVGSYRISYRAKPTELAVEDPLILTLRITGIGPEKYHPRREKLGVVLKELEEDFYIEPAPEHDRRLPAENAWEFAWRLRPKQVGEMRLPSLELVYYDPRAANPEWGYKPTRTREVIVLKVTPRPLAPIKVEPVKALQAPERFFALVAGESVLSRDRGDLSPLLLAALLLGPPILCGLWYLVWRRLHPDSGRQRRRLANQAAREALATLEALGPQAGGERAAATLADYLRRRLDLRGSEPTPAEVAAHLKRSGLSPALVNRAADLFRACDAARFTPSHAPPSALAAGAVDLVHALEAELCAPA
ncbi:MAG: hypothetical protein L0Z62_38950 [Gemmataceae bacterium]|nr:hypothetical protein [Gemmataceae bacterium]